MEPLVPLARKSLPLLETLENILVVKHNLAQNVGTKFIPDFLTDLAIANLFKVFIVKGSEFFVHGGKIARVFILSISFSHIVQDFLHFFKINFFTQWLAAIPARFSVLSV